MGDESIFEAPATVIRPYFGKVKSSQSFNGLKLIEATYAPNVHLPMHSHPHASFCFILKGGYTESYGNYHLECGPFQLKFQPAGESHTDSYGLQEGRSFIIELEPEWLDRMRSCSLSVSTPSLVKDGSSITPLHRLRRELHQTDDVTPVAVEGLMLELISGLARNRRRLPRSNSHWLEAAKELLHAHFAEHLTLSEIARTVGVHPVYLAESFRLQNGCSIGEYLRKLRIEFAQRRLLESDDPLTEIALAAGFSNQSHFARVFKRFTGQTPSRYRHSLKS
jgi:AraC family transcriptional regulator